MMWYKIGIIISKNLMEMEGRDALLWCATAGFQCTHGIAVDPF